LKFAGIRCLKKTPSDVNNFLGIVFADLLIDIQVENFVCRYAFEICVLTQVNNCIPHAPKFIQIISNFPRENIVVK